MPADPPPARPVNAGGQDHGRQMDSDEERDFADQNPLTDEDMEDDTRILATLLKAIPFCMNAADIEKLLPSGTPMRYIVGIYHVYTMYIPRGCIYMVYTMYILWISKFHFHVFMCNSMLYTIAMDRDNVMLKPEIVKKAQFSFKTSSQKYLVYT